MFGWFKKEKIESERWKEQAAEYNNWLQKCKDVLDAHPECDVVAVKSYQAALKFVNSTKGPSYFSGPAYKKGSVYNNRVAWNEYGQLVRRFELFAVERTICYFIECPSLGEDEIIPIQTEAKKLQIEKERKQRAELEEMLEEGRARLNK